LLVAVLKRKYNCSDFSARLLEEFDNSEKVMTADEIWVFYYDPKTKLRKLQWKFPERQNCETVRIKGKSHGDLLFR
jgi:hypothetical protein